MTLKWIHKTPERGIVLGSTGVLICFFFLSFFLSFFFSSKREIIIISVVMKIQMQKVKILV